MQDLKDYQLNDADNEVMAVYELFLDDLFLFSDGLATYDNINYRKLNRDECLDLVYKYREQNSMVAYAVLFEELFIIFKRHLKNKKFKTLTSRDGMDGMHYEDDLYQDFYFIFDDIINKFKAVKFHSFKKYGDLIIRGQIHKLIKEKYFYCYKKPYNKDGRHDVFDLSEASSDNLAYQNNLDMIEDPNNVEEKVFEMIEAEQIIEILKEAKKNKKIKENDIPIFCHYYGILTHKKKQREIAEIYRCSISTVSKRVTKVRTMLSSNNDLKNLAKAELNKDFDRKLRHKSYGY